MSKITESLLGIRSKKPAPKSKPKSKPKPKYFVILGSFDVGGKISPAYFDGKDKFTPYIHKAKKYASVAHAEDVARFIVRDLPHSARHIVVTRYEA